MRLDFEQIKEVTVGSLLTEMKGDGIHFHKCTKKQESAWRNCSEGLGMRAETTTGVRLDFHTNSRNVAFRASLGSKFELHVDGVLRKQFKFAEGNDRIGSFELKTPFGRDKDSYRVTLHFPSHGIGVLDWIEIDDGATVTPHRFDKKLLFLGDSLTQGWQSVIDTCSYAYRVSSFFNAESVIQGIGGAYFCEECFDCITFDPDEIVVAYGTNDFDFYKEIDIIRAHAEGFLRLVAEKYAGKKVYVVIPTWRSFGEQSTADFARCRDAIAEIANSLGFACVDGAELVPPIPELFYGDPVHPNALGFSIYADALIKKMIQI